MAEIKKVGEDRQTPNDDMKYIEDKMYNVNLFRIFTAISTTQNSKAHSNNEFKVEVIVNNTLITAMADTGARVNVHSLQKQRNKTSQKKCFLQTQD